MDHDDTRRDAPERASARRTTLAVGAALALGVTGLAVFGSDLARAGDPTLSASVDDSAQRRADALAAVEADVESVELVRLGDTTSGDDGPGDDPDRGLPTVDDLGDTLGGVVSTVTEAAADVGACLLAQLPDVLGGGDGDEPPTDDPCDFLPWVDRIGTEIDTLDVSDVVADVGDRPEAGDVTSLDPGDLGLDDLLRDLDLSDLTLGDLTPDDLGLGDAGAPDGSSPGDPDPGVFDQARETAVEFAEEIVDFVETLPDEVGSRWNDLFD